MKENLEKGIRAYEEILKEMEEALRRNVEYPSDKQRYELTLVDIKEKKGWFFSLLRKYLKYKLKKSVNNPAKKLTEDSRRFLEEKIKDCKKTIASTKRLSNNL